MIIMAEKIIEIKDVKIGKSGRHSFITIPKSFIDNGIVDPRMSYDVKLLEKKEDEKNE